MLISSHFQFYEILRENSQNHLTDIVIYAKTSKLKSRVQVKRVKDKGSNILISDSLKKRRLSNE